MGAPDGVVVIRLVSTRVSSYVIDVDASETINGLPVTDQQSAWAAEAEAGYDVGALKKRGRGRPGRGAEPSQVVALRLTAEEIARSEVWIEDLDDDSPARQLRLGFDRQGRMLEVVVLVFDSGNELVIHAMKARPQVLDLLP